MMRDVVPTQVGPFAECPRCRHWLRLSQFAPTDDGAYSATCPYCEDDLWLVPPDELELG